MEDNIHSDLVTPETCASCGAKLKDKYCRKCGEKKVVPEQDFSIRRFLSQTIGHFFHLDSKLLRSFWLLCSNPGFLSAEWVAGRRVGYMKPLQLFIVAGLLFYFLLPNVTAYYSSSQDLINGLQENNQALNTFHFDLDQALAEKAAFKHVSIEALTDGLKLAASKESKTWLFCIIPLWGSLLYLLFKRKMPWLVPNLVFAMHGLTFFILTDLIFHLVTSFLGLARVGSFILPSLMGILLMYLTLALQQVYRVGWLEAMVKAAVLVLGFGGILLLYRQLITILTLMAL